MAAKAVGKIESVDGAGKVLIIRSTGESVVAKPGDTVFEGDAVVTSSNTKALIRVSEGQGGVVALDNALYAKFDTALFESIGVVLPNSSEIAPVNIGEKPQQGIIDQFNAVFPDAGITSAEEDSRSNQVQSDDLDDLGSSFGDESGNLQNTPIISFNDLDILERQNNVEDRDDRLFDFDQNDRELLQFFAGRSDSPLTERPPILESPEVTIIPLDAIDDFVATAEDTTLTINALANDEVAGVSVSEHFRVLGIELPVTGNLTTGGSTTGDSTTGDPTTGGSTTGDPTTGDPTTGDPATGDPLTDPFDPINIKSSNDDNRSFFDRVVDFFRNGGSAAKGVEVELSEGLFVRLSLIGDGTSENGGSVTQNPDGTFNYTPPTDFVGTDTFAYLVTGPQGQTDIALVTVDVTPVSDTVTFTSSDSGVREIGNFTIANASAGGDILDLRNLLQDEQNHELSDYLSVVDGGVNGDVTILIDADRNGSNDLTLILSDAGTGNVSLDSLVGNSQIIIDQ